MLTSSHNTTEIEPHRYGFILGHIQHLASQTLAKLVHRPRLLRALTMVLTLALHLLAIWLMLIKSSAPEESRPRLHFIHLNPLAESQGKKHEKPVIAAPSIKSEKIDPESVTKLQMIDLDISSHSIIELTPEDLKAIAAEGDQSPSAIVKNVFDPRMRQRLEEEANKPVRARVEDQGLETYLDPAGATIVVSGNGNCMRSPPTKIGEPKNWYSVACSGKNESERMMDRVNEAVKGKLKPQ